nr:uncharacterized protein LOC132430339 [Delphinus delphis]
MEKVVPEHLCDEELGSLGQPVPPGPAPTSITFSLRRGRLDPAWDESRARASPQEKLPFRPRRPLLRRQRPKRAQGGREPEERRPGDPASLRGQRFRILLGVRAFAPSWGLGLLRRRGQGRPGLARPCPALACAAPLVPRQRFVTPGRGPARRRQVLPRRWPIWDGAGLLGATIAPFPGDVTQGELLHPLPGSLCSHPGILRFFSVLPLQFASTPLAAGHCLQEALVKYPRITWEQLAHRSTQWLFTRASRHARHQSSVITDRRCLSQASSVRCFSFPFQRSYKGHEHVLWDRESPCAWSRRPGLSCPRPATRD